MRLFHPECRSAPKWTPPRRDRLLAVFAGLPLTDVATAAAAPWSRPLRDEPLLAALLGAGCMLLLCLTLMPRRRSARPVVDTERRLLDIFDNLDAVVYVADPHTDRILFANARAWHLFGPVEGEPCWRALQGRDDRCPGCPIHTAAPASQADAPARSWTIDNPRDGRWYECRDRLIPWSGGGQGRLVIATDITERRLAEHAREESARLFEALFLNSPVCILIHDAVTGELLDANPTACARYGYGSLASLRADAAWLWLEPPYSLADALRWNARTLAEGPQQFEWCYRHRGGETRWEWVHLAPIVMRDRRCILATAADISQRKQAEQSLRESNARLQETTVLAEQAARAKGQFLANMTHEIRTPLNAIIGFAQLLVDTEDLPAKTVERARLIARGGTHLLGLVNDLLDLSQIEAGRLAVRATDFDPRVCFAELTEMFQPSAAAKGLALYLDGHRRLPGLVHADAAKLRQVAINLLGNALKFTARGSVRVGVWTGVRPVDRLPPGAAGDTWATLHVAVEDSGPGIAPAEREAIFDAFHQASLGQTTGGGIGLGLAISRHLVELMGGRLELDSQEGRGSRFHFQIPVRLPTAHRTPADHPPPMAARMPDARDLAPILPDGAGAPDAEPCEPVPPPYRAALRQALDTGDIDALGALIAGMATDHPTLARRLERLAARYDYDQIECLLQ